MQRDLELCFDHDPPFPRVKPPLVVRPDIVPGLDLDPIYQASRIGNGQNDLLFSHRLQ